MDFEVPEAALDAAGIVLRFCCLIKSSPQSQFAAQLEILLAPPAHRWWTLINAGLVDGKQITSWLSLRVDLENASANWQDSEVVEGRNLITSRNPDDIPTFTNALIYALEGRAHQTT